jgi:hypothetical protein
MWPDAPWQMMILEKDGMVLNETGRYIGAHRRGSVWSRRHPMSASALLIWSCLLQSGPMAQPPTSSSAKESKDARGVVVDVFADGLLLMSVGDDDDAVKGDHFDLVRPGKKWDHDGKRDWQNVNSAKIVSLGKHYSLAKVELPSPDNKPFVGDSVSMSTWENRKRNLDMQMQHGGALTINGK